MVVQGKFVSWEEDFSSKFWDKYLICTFNKKPSKYGTWWAGCIYEIIGRVAHCCGDTGITVNGMHNRRYHCPEDFIRLANSCYFLSVYMDTWSDAQNTCKNKFGSHLATPDRKWKDQRLKNLLSLTAASKPLALN